MNLLAWPIPHEPILLPKRPSTILVQRQTLKTRKMGEPHFWRDRLGRTMQYLAVDACSISRWDGGGWRRASESENSPANHLRPPTPTATKRNLHHVRITTQSTANPRTDERLPAGLRYRGRRRTRPVDRLGRPVAPGRAIGQEAPRRPAGDHHAAGCRRRARASGEARHPLQRAAGIAALADRREPRDDPAHAATRDEHLARLVAIGPE